MSRELALEEVRCHVAEHIATIMLDRPERRNALTKTMIRDLLKALRWCRDEADVRVVVLSGSGDRAFCAGADLGSFHDQESELERHHARHDYVELFLLLEDLGKPVVGRINGVAFAGGFGLACACDLLVAVDTATFGTPEINVGVWPMMVEAILARNLPRKALLEMLMLGHRWTAAQLRDLGLVNRLVSADQLDEVTYGLARELAAKSPAIMRLGRDSFYRQQDMELRAALEYLQSQVTMVTLTEDSKEGQRAFFEKRPPEYRGR